MKRKNKIKYDRRVKIKCEDRGEEQVGNERGGSNKGRVR